MIAIKTQNMSNNFIIFNNDYFKIIIIFLLIHTYALFCHGSTCSIDDMSKNIELIIKASDGPIAVIQKNQLTYEISKNYQGTLKKANEYIELSKNGNDVDNVKLNRDIATLYQKIGRYSESKNYQIRAANHTIANLQNNRNREVYDIIEAMNDLVKVDTPESVIEKLINNKLINSENIDEILYDFRNRNWYSNIKLNTHRIQTILNDTSSFKENIVKESIDPLSIYNYSKNNLELASGYQKLAEIGAKKFGRGYEYTSSAKNYVAEWTEMTSKAEKLVKQYYTDFKVITK